MRTNLLRLSIFIFILPAICACNTYKQISAAIQANYWITKPDRSALLQQQATLIYRGSITNSYPVIDADTTHLMQSVDGFGFALTGGSAALIHRLDAATRAALLQELCGDGMNDIGVSYLRISIGASDLDSAVFSYDDLPEGATDVELKHFSLAPDKQHLIPLLKEIIAIRPGIKLMGSPWSPPVWMKDNHQSKGGSLLPMYYQVYADYFVKYIQEMKANGITIDAITPQNEPLHPGNNPSMLMVASQEAEFIRDHLGPAFRKAGMNTKIIIYDHNCDRPDYPLAILNDPEARQYVDGSAFHLYGGDISALTQVHNAYPGKNLYFTEQWTGANESFADNLKWHVKNVIIGSMRNWSRIALEWNLANDPAYNPHTPGGCSECKGALTIGNGISRNPSYYIVAHASKFVPAGSVRMESNIPGNLVNVAFRTPSGQTAVIVENDGSNEETFNIRAGEKWIKTTLTPGAVGTYVF